MVEGKLPSHVVEQPVLDNKDQVLRQMSECLHLMVKLHEDGLCCHLPIHAERLPGGRGFPIVGHANELQEPLSRRPYRACGVKRLKFDADEVDRTSAVNRDQEVIDATAWDTDLRHDVKLIARLVQGQQMNAVGEDLAALQEAEGTNDDRRLSIVDGARAYGNVRLTLSDLDALSVQIWTMLSLDHGLPALPSGGREPEQLNNLVAIAHPNITSQEDRTAFDSLLKIVF